MNGTSRRRRGSSHRRAPTSVRPGAGSVVAFGLLVSTASGVAAQSSDFHATEPGPTHLSARAGWDVGTGFLRIRPSPDGPPGTAPADTFRILSAPRSGAPAVGRVFHRGFRLIVEAREEELVDAALEVGYEERALPVFRSGPEGRWLEVSYAFDGDGEPRTGWVDRNHPVLEHRSWDGWLRETGVLFFLDTDSIAFFAAREGNLRDLTLEPMVGSRRYDYAMHPVVREGASEGADGNPWMEVRVVSPSNGCAGPDPEVDADRDSVSGSSLRERVWIRYLTEDGRPRVWYFTRGC